MARYNQYRPKDDMRPMSGSQYGNAKGSPMSMSMNMNINKSMRAGIR